MGIPVNPIVPVDESLARARIVDALERHEELCEAFVELGEQPGPVRMGWGMCISFVELDGSPTPEDIINTPARGGLVRPDPSRAGAGERVMLAVTATDSTVLTAQMLPHIEACGVRLLGFTPVLLDAGESVYSDSTSPMRHLKLTLVPAPLKPTAEASANPVMLRTGVGPDDVCREPLVLLCVSRPAFMPP